MGAGWRRWKEKVRESMPGTHADLTSNARWGLLAAFNGAARSFKRCTVYWMPRVGLR